MTGNLFLDSAISLSAIGLMILAAWLAFRAPPVAVDETAARARLAFDEPDFKPAVWVMDEEGRAALAEGTAGEFALVRRLGADLVTRRFARGEATVQAENGALTVRPADPGSRAVTLRCADAAHWARKIASA